MVRVEIPRAAVIVLLLFGLIIGLISSGLVLALVLQQ